MGASLLVFKNKSDVLGAMSIEDIRRVIVPLLHSRDCDLINEGTGSGVGQHTYAQMEHHHLQCRHRRGFEGGNALGCSRRKGPSVPVLTSAPPDTFPVIRL